MFTMQGIAENGVKQAGRSEMQKGPVDGKGMNGKTDPNEHSSKLSEFERALQQFHQEQQNEEKRQDKVETGAMPNVLVRNGPIMNTPGTQAVTNHPGEQVRA